MLNIPTALYHWISNESFYMKLPDMLQFQGERLFSFHLSLKIINFYRAQLFHLLQIAQFCNSYLYYIALLRKYQHIICRILQFCVYFLAQYCNIIVGGIHMDQRAELLRKLMDSKNMKVSDIVKILVFPTLQ